MDRSTASPEPSGTVRTVAVVLAAGAGTRFESGHKLLAPFRGRPMVSWALEHAVQAGLDATGVVTGAVDLGHLVPAGVAVLHNERWADGQAGSLGIAVAWARALGAEAAVVGLGDQPLVTTTAWRAVAGAAGGDGVPPITVATYRGQRGHPVRLGRAVWPLLPDHGDEGARRLMRVRPDLVGEVPCPGTAADIDTVEDLERWS
jgi:CTP:molybdopterin cytidylyltransferase MocA